MLRKDSLKTAFFDRVHRGLGRSGRIARLSVKARNQLDSTIGAYLGESANSRTNGEFLLLDLIAPKCQYFVDVGANTGEWSRYFLSKSHASGVLYEPSAQAHGVLRGAFANERVEIRNVALGDRIGEVLFVEEDGCGQTSSALEAHAPTDTPSRWVEISTLDHDLGPAGTEIDFLKIDAEGYDLKVLRGAVDLIERGRVRWIQFEYNSSWLATDSSLRSAERYLGSFGYSLLLIRSSGLHPFDYSFWGDYYRYSNFLACRMTDVSMIAPLLRQKL